MRTLLKTLAVLAIFLVSVGTTLALTSKGPILSHNRHGGNGIVFVDHAYDYCPKVNWTDTYSGRAWLDVGTMERGFVAMAVFVGGANAGGSVTMFLDGSCSTTVYSTTGSPTAPAENDLGTDPHVVVLNNGNPLYNGWYELPYVTRYVRLRVTAVNGDNNPIVIFRLVRP